jgi:hypothetical protein
VGLLVSVPALIAFAIGIPQSMLDPVNALRTFGGEPILAAIVFGRLKERMVEVCLPKSYCNPVKRLDGTTAVDALEVNAVLSLRGIGDEGRIAQLTTLLAG